MKRMIAVGIMAAFGLSALAADTKVAPTIGGAKLTPVKAVVAHKTINMRTGEQTDGQNVPREDVIVWQNDSTPTGFGYGDVVGAYTGDFHQMTQGGLLNTLTFSVFNANEGDGFLLESMTVSIDIYAGFFELLGTINTETITFDPPLNPGEAATLTLTDLAGGGLTVPPNIYTAIAYLDVTGGCDTVGPIFYELYDGVAIGGSGGNFYLDTSWPDFDEFYADTYTVVGLSEVGEEQQVAGTGGSRVVVNGGTNVYLGYLAGYVDDTRPQRWVAAPFALANDTQVTTIDFWAFTNDEATELRYRIYDRDDSVNNPPNTEAELIVDGYLGPYDIGIEPRSWFYTFALETPVDLAAGNYWLTIYAAGGDTPNDIAWLSGGGNQSEDLEQDQMWRSLTWPSPGYAAYAPSAITAPEKMADPEDRWNECFTIRGIVSGGAPCEGVVCGDSNGDGSVNFDDIDCFVAALIGIENWLACGTAYGEADYVCANSTNKDGSVDFSDIDSFVSSIIDGACP